MVALEDLKVTITDAGIRGTRSIINQLNEAIAAIKGTAPGNPKTHAKKACQALDVAKKLITAFGIQKITPAQKAEWSYVVDAVIALRKC